MTADLTRVENGASVIISASVHMDDALKAYALLLREPNLPATTKAGLFAALKDHEQMFKTIFSTVRARIEDMVLEEGRVISDAGTKELRVGPFVLTAKVANTQVDPKRLEALLRARNLDPTHHMDVTMTFSVNEDKLQAAVERGLLTEEDIRACRHELKYAIQKPRKVGSK